MIDSKAKRVATFKKAMTSVIKKAHKLSITMGAHIVIPIYSSNGKSYFYDSSINFHTIATFLNKKLKNIVANPDDVKAMAVLHLAIKWS